jgi:O-methyltransferase
LNSRLPDSLHRLLRRTPANAARSGPPALPDEKLAELSPADRRIVEAAFPYTMTGPDRLASVVDAVRYCVARGIPGSFAECGVWRGGSVLAMILTLQDLGVGDRDVFLYDTFEGMTEPTESDVAMTGESALDAWKDAQARDERAFSEMFGRHAFDEQSVRDVVLGTSYPAERIHFVRGPVEETIPATIPEALALLRLDTDWYESTRHELEHLYPRLGDGGVLFFDDYGHWEGARRAVDEYFASGAARPLLLNRIDYTGRIAVKH